MKFSELFLSKSKYVDGVQCEKLLWHRVRDRAAVPPPSAETMAVFEQGRQVGELARTLYPGGVTIPWERDVERAIEKSQMALADRRTVFECWIVSAEACAKVDILHPAGGDRWDLIEVKSATEVKKEYYEDIAFQLNTCEDAGLQIRNCFVMYIDKTYVRDGDIEPSKILTREDVTDKVRKLAPEVRKSFTILKSVLQKDKAPHVEIGYHCKKPYVCPLKDSCWSHMPEQHVLTLYYDIRLKTGTRLMSDGILALKDVPEDTKLTAFQAVQVECARSGRPHLDGERIREFLERLRYPLYYLDFETIFPAIPAYNMTRPYQQVPFQYSLAVQTAPDATAECFDYLADGPDDPRPEILRRLSDRIGKDGTIVAYNAKFELQALAGAVEFYPEFEEWFESMKSRVVDLWEPFSTCAYYHPKQNGSTSLKVVLPALTGRTYKGMAISDGGAASREFYRITFGGAAAEDRQKVRAALETYCRQDTAGMVEIVKALEKLAE